MKMTRGRKQLFWSIVRIGGICAIWQVVVMGANVPAYVLPTPQAVLHAAIEEASTLLLHSAYTSQLILSGLLGGCATGVVVAVVLHVYAPIRMLLLPVLVWMQNVPFIVIAPLFVLWFGFGLLPKVLLIVGVCFFPVAMSTLDGLRRVDAALWRYAQMSGATRTQLLFRLELPWALPQLFSGCKLAATYSVLGAVISEWVGAAHGLGVYLMIKKSSFEVADMFVAVIVIALLSQWLVQGIGWLQRRTVRWNNMNSD